MLGRDLGQFLCLPFKVVEEALKFLKDEKNIEVMGGDLVGEVSYRFSLTDLGRRRAQEAMEMCAYCRPGPGAARGLRRADLPPGRDRHPLHPGDAWRRRSRTWSSRTRCSTPSARRSCPAAACSSTARRATARPRWPASIGEFMNQAGGGIYVPYAFLAEGSIITVYDPSLHQVGRERRTTASSTRTRASSGC